MAEAGATFSEQVTFNPFGEGTMAEGTGGITVTESLTGTQVMVLRLAAAEQSRLQEQGRVLLAEGQAVMNRAVMAIRADFQVPVEMQVRFRDSNGAVVMEWDQPATGPALVKEDAPDTGVATTT